MKGREKKGRNEGRKKEVKNIIKMKVTKYTPF
jgi:hypothetical protein